MFEERKLLKLLEKDCEERRERNLQRLKELHPDLFPQREQVAKKKFNKKWFGFIVPAASVAVGLAIVLPIVLVGNNAIIPNEPFERYCFSSEYSLIEVDETIKQYNAMSNVSYCYFDWYDIAEDISTHHYVDNISKEVLGVSESMYNTELEIVVDFQATPKYIYLEDLEINREVCKNEILINGSSVIWNTVGDNILSITEYNDYRYYVTLFYSNDETQLFSLIEELLQ